MTAESLSIPAESLLRHRAFVRALARSLVRDEHAAEDLVQETWLTALRHSPSLEAALPAWLGRVVRTRAQNAARGEARRVAREAAAAREEAVDSEEGLRESLAMQHRVVAAVLDLKEPYRSVVLLRYYEGLSPSAIAERRGAPAGTIRAQLSRAHDLLRDRLDAEFGGSRKAWSAGLLLLLGKQKTVLGGAKIAIAAGLLLAVVVVPVAWRGLTTRNSEPSSEPTLVAAEPQAPTEGLALDASSESEAPPPVRNAIAVAALQGPAAAPPTDADLAALSIDDSLVLARQIQIQLQKRLLVPDTNPPEIREALERDPNLQLARILPYGRLEGDIDGRFLGIPGAGAFFSFFTRSNNYDRQPDIHLDSRLSSGSYGGTAGFMVDIGEVALGSVPDSQARGPANSPNLSPAVWDLLWMDAKTVGRGFEHAIEDRARELKIEDFADPVMDHTYLVRAILPGEHDVLAAFRIVSKDEYGYTFAWRLLHSWPVPADANKPHEADLVAPPAPPWLSNLEVPGLMELSHRVRRASQPKLFPQRPDLEQKFPSAAGEAAAGVARMLHRGRFDAIVDGRERGAYYSFATRSNDFDAEQDLCFEQGYLHPSATWGILLDVGKVDMQALVHAGEAGAAGLDKSRVEAQKLFWTMKHAETIPGQSPRPLSGEDELRAQDLKLRFGEPAVVGHTYLLRSIEPDKHDLLVGFTVLEKDDNGLWLAWRQLRSWSW